MPVPFKVKAVFEYRSEEPDDLNFDNGQIITVTEDDDADWYTGEYSTSDGVKKDGIFPRNFVEKYEPAIPTRPVRAPRKVPQPDPEPEPAQPTPSVATFPPPAHEPSREAEIEPPREIAQPAPAPAPVSNPVRAASPPPQPEKSTPVKKAPPPVVEKPSSFRDRIAAFNKPAAAPLAPFKPAPAGGAGFIKKPYVAPPPSRNAYVPPQRDLPPPKVYRREEEMEHERERAEPEEPPRQVSLTSERSAQEEDQPKPTSLKDRIALLQQQQLEQAQKQADSAKKKDKPKRPAKPRTESQEGHAETVDDGPTLERVSTERAYRDPDPIEERPLSRKSTEVHSAVTMPPLPTPSRELVSDTNDADDSGAADTEDSHDISTEEERPSSRSIKSPTMPAEPEPAAEEEEDDEDTEEEEDPEVRRKRELRERMAKMSGGMGMMGMFGAGAAPQPSRAKSTRQRVQRDPEPEEHDEPQRAPPVPIMPGMALPGMARPAQPAPKESDDEYATAEPTPMPTHEDPAQEDYIAQRLSRRSTTQTPRRKIVLLLHHRLMIDRNHLNHLAPVQYHHPHHRHNVAICHLPAISMTPIMKHRTAHLRRLLDLPMSLHVQYHLRLLPFRPSHLSMLREPFLQYQ